MARLYEPIDEQSVAKTPVAQMRKEYVKISSQYSKFANAELTWCPKCGEALNVNTAFYKNSDYKLGYFPICKRCVLAMVEQRTNKNDTPNETPESVQKVLQMMDLPYIDSFYKNCVKGTEEGVKEKNRKSAWGTYYTSLTSLPNWKGLKYADSEFGDTLKDSEEDIRLVQKTIKNGKKRFGQGYADVDYQFLENEYQSWISRYKAENKAHEDLFEMLSLNKWQRREALKAGKPTKDLDKTYQDLLSSVNILPRQNSGNGLTDSLTFGQLIEKWEKEKPIPEPEPEFRDVNKIGKYIRVWFKGHLARSLGLDNGYSQEYDDYVSKYTVTKATHEDEERSEGIYNTIFGGPNE